MASGGLVAERKAGTKEGALTPFGKAIVRRIKELQADDPTMTRERIAKLAGMSRQHLWRALRGKAVLTVYEVAQLARVLGLHGEDVYVTFWDSMPLAGGGSITPWSYAEMQEYLVDHVLPKDALLVKEGDSRYVVRLDNREPSISGEIVDEIPPRSDVPLAPTRPNVLPNILPRDLQILAEEFKLEALRAGADDQERTFIASVLASPEAIFRQSGYHGSNLTAEEQRTELESVIAMLRQWLKEHMRQRAAKVP